LCKALLGHAVGDDVVVEAPEGQIVYRITKLDLPHING